MNKYKKVEKLLSKYKMLNINIENMKAEIEFLKNEDGQKGLNYDAISTSPTNEFKSATENTALANVEKAFYLERQIQKATLEIESVDRALEGLTHTERIVMVEKYIENKQWWQVASKACYSERHCKRIRMEAINRMIIGMYGEDKKE